MAFNQHPQKPNILIIITDQQSANMMSCTGNSWVKTPAMDKLASEGMRFERAICSNPVCVPSRTSIATGLMSCRLEAHSNETGMKISIPQTVADNSLGEMMKKAGYSTYYGGKVHMCPQLQPLAAGYDIYDENEREELPENTLKFLATVKNGEKPFFAIASFINPHDICFAHFAKMGKTLKPGKEGEATALANRLYEEAIAIPENELPPLPDNFEIPAQEPSGISARKRKKAITPSGLMSNTYSELDWRIYRWIYARMTELVDNQIGRVLRGLQELGLEQDTLVIFTSDHGNMHGNHRLASKGVFYEESIGVPFIMKHPGAIREGVVNNHQLVNIGLDLLPTCCEFAKIEVPAGLVGISHKGAAEQAADFPKPSYVVSENRDGRVLRTQNWKYCVYRPESKPRESLINLEKDPGEMDNLALEPNEREQLLHHRRLLKDWMAATNDQYASLFMMDDT